MVTFVDLLRFQSGHPPAPYGPAPLIRRGATRGFGFLPRGLDLYAVGWIGERLDSIGETPGDCIERLIDAYQQGLVIPPFGPGPWDCGLCVTEPLCSDYVEYRGKGVPIIAEGHHLVRDKGCVYMCPAFILHYITGHQYRPPDEFIRATIDGQFLSIDDLVFTQEHRAP